jgi:hypothetical protein
VVGYGVRCHRPFQEESMTADAARPWLTEVLRRNLSQNGPEAR